MATSIVGLRTVVNFYARVNNMNARPGRPPKKSVGRVSTLTLRIPANIKDYIIETSENLDMSLTEYIIMLVTRDAAEGEV